MTNAQALVSIEPVWVDPVDGVITSYGGLRVNPVTHKTEFHDGLDIACPVGTPVMATRKGTVLATGVSSTYGHYVKLAFEEDYTAIYAHLSEVLVKENENVAQGQVVAYSGNTGRSTGPHLHYGLYQGGQYINSAQYVNLYDVDGNTQYSQVANQQNNQTNSASDTRLAYKEAGEP